MPSLGSYGAIVDHAEIGYRSKEQQYPESKIGYTFNRASIPRGIQEKHGEKLHHECTQFARLVQ